MKQTSLLWGVYRIGGLGLHSGDLRVVDRRDIRVAGWEDVRG